jgi:hypothetical protein
MMKYQSQEEVCIVVLDEFTKHFALSFHLIWMLVSFVGKCVIFEDLR